MNDDRNGWEGDFWDAVPPDSQYRQDRRGEEAGRSCRNLGIASLVLSVSAFMGLAFLGSAAAIALSVTAKSRGEEARSFGYDGRDVKTGLAAGMAGRIIGIIYLVLAAIAIAVMAVVFASLVKYANM